ncbi:MAG: hypothetical protein GY754_24200, partial [bacterium]|nr:hypothetical protein [bacterium]
MTKYLIIIVLAFLTAGKIPLRAETPPPKKKTIAVMKIRANNCPAPLAMAVQDMLAGKIFKINFFSLLERSQVGQIINENNFDEDKCDDSECAVKLGQILSADKIVMGSISKLNTYRIEIRVINIADRKVDISIPAEVEREKDFEETVAKIVQDIKHYYQGYSSISGAFDLSLAGTFIAGIGDLTNGAQYGYGASLDFFINKPLGWKFPVIIGTGFYSFVPEIISIDSMYMVPLKAGAAYPISITENVRFYPSITMGYLF